MADGALPAADALAEVLADVRRYLGWHRDVAGEELHASMDGALGAVAAAMSVEVTVEGSSTPPVVLEYAEVSAEASRGHVHPEPPPGTPPVRVEVAAEASTGRPATARPLAPVRPPVTAPEPALVASTEEPRLDEVRRALGDCRRCKLCSGRKNLVFGVGNPRARLVFVGEGPGAEEDNQGIPFVGAAGQLLTKMIAAMGYTRDEVYICNVVKCRPPGNRNPEPDEIAACQPFLEAQLSAIRPSVIVTLGKFAAQTLLRTDTPITRLRGQWREYVGVPLMPTFHPAYLLRTPAEKKAAWTDLQEVMARFPKPGA
ncbi:MAG TPA: uracil-DNA glycosylase [Myxococcaceae bacterium]|nr:uracil-DNA glycosylase [Myxococcaceae bacterium]